MHLTATIFSRHQYKYEPDIFIITSNSFYFQPMISNYFYITFKTRLNCSKMFQDFM